jgi:GNAT superfamily N-acetyltransferase
MARPASVRIVRACEAADLVRGGSNDIDRIFFASSATQAFESADERAIFRERWLGRYLDLWPHLFLVAAMPDGRIAGYLAGCLDDPAASPLFADHPYLQSFAHLTPNYPAHLHVNVDPAWRSFGVGADLVNGFCDIARQCRSPGVHVVTALGARNVGFYRRNGFEPVATAAWNGRALVMLGRRLD